MKFCSRPLRFYPAQHNFVQNLFYHCTTLSIYTYVAGAENITCSTFQDLIKCPNIVAPKTLYLFKATASYIRSNLISYVYQYPKTLPTYWKKSVLQNEPFLICKRQSNNLSRLNPSYWFPFLWIYFFFFNLLLFSNSEQSNR